MTPPPPPTTAVNAATAAPSFRVTDLRGGTAADMAGTATPAVLEDPSGRRRRRMRIAGRALTAALVVWLLLLVLGGLGVVPGSWVPFEHSLGPPRIAALRHAPTVVQAATRAPISAAAAATTAVGMQVATGSTSAPGSSTSRVPAGAVASGHGHTRPVAVRGKHSPAVSSRAPLGAGAVNAVAAKPGHGVKSAATSTTSTRGKSTTAPGRGGTQSGQSSTTPAAANATRSRGSGSQQTTSSGTPVPASGNGKKGTVTTPTG